MKNTYPNSAWLYDYDSDNECEDTLFYLEYARKYGEVLELGCGTGRISLALAKEGICVTGIDLSPHMLEVFEKKLVENPKLSEKARFIQCSMSNFSLNRKFPMIIIPARTFQALTKNRDIKRTLSHVVEHLTDNGIFIVNVFNPVSNMNRKSSCQSEVVVGEWNCANSNALVKKSYWCNKINTRKQLIYPNYRFDVTYPDGESEQLVEKWKLRYHYEDQLRNILEKAGLYVTEEFSRYDKTPIKGHTKQDIIFVCMKNPS
ncbi:MAG: class I SAM-dependent methyltransferase [Lachnoclostridium sp.]|jgi:ubiquinone/menaquinone biosynthesis C-methylase UbiE|nr:class I SAM-dependent methyltransferase [Lachnoclostridium sp.]